MKLFYYLVTTILLALPAIAELPSHDEVLARLRRNRALARRDMANYDHPVFHDSDRLPPLNLSSLHPRLWSGGVIANETYKTISAEVIIPNITFPYRYNASATYEALVFVGISGVTQICGNDCGLWQMGFFYLYTPEGDFGVYPWYEWYPGQAMILTTEYQISIGDHIRMTATVNDELNVGTAIWEDFTTKLSYTFDEQRPANSSFNPNVAEWIVENYMWIDPNLLFPDFGTMEWFNITPISTRGRKVPISQAGTLDAEPLRDGRYLTKCENHSKTDSTTCKWLGYADIFPEQAGVSQK